MDRQPAADSCMITLESVASGKKEAAELISLFQKTQLLRPIRLERYEAGTVLRYHLRGIIPDTCEYVTLRIEDFVGGGFAGQVYRVRILEASGNIQGVERDKICAMKILRPPSSAATLFRDLLYRIGFQAPFQLQVNPSALRSQALWQKLIRRAAAVRFGSEEVVADIYGTFVDEVLGSNGELLEWIDGRTWLLEVDDNLTALRMWRRGRPVDRKFLGSPEYRAKRVFMARFVGLLHELGAHELARQYEWWTCKSQPNCLKRLESEGNAEEGLTAVDFRPGLVLLPFFPMSPADFVLIAKGIARGSLVQFDRGDLNKLESFVRKNEERFKDLLPVYEELLKEEEERRSSIPDLSRQGFKLLANGKLRRKVLQGFITSWETSNVIDKSCAASFRRRSLPALGFAFLGLLGFFAPLWGALLALSLGLGLWQALAGAAFAALSYASVKIARRLWGRKDYREHYKKILFERGYFKRALKGKIVERLISWLRKGRVSGEKALYLSSKPLHFFYHLPLSLLPPSLHRFLTDFHYARERLEALLIRPLRLYFNAEERERWLREMVEEGKRKHMLTEEDADTIISQIKEPFIQKYLKSLAVHVCTLPVTQLVAAAVAVYGIIRFQMSWDQAWKFAGGVFILFQLTPVSPGSLLRGLYVVYLVLRERNFKYYNIAVFLGFMKYIGYLAFPIQMTYRYPTLARFMACHWATEAVHVVPVFGERGALLEHGVFNLFYNWPLTIRRRMRERAKLRSQLPARRWHILPAVGFSAAVFAIWAWFGRTDPFFFNLRNWWFVVAFGCMVAGFGASAFAGGLSLGKRALLAALGGVGIAASLALVVFIFGSSQIEGWRDGVLGLLLWPWPFAPLLSVIVCLLREVSLPEVRSFAPSGEEKDQACSLKEAILSGAEGKVNRV